MSEREEFVRKDSHDRRLELVELLSHEAPDLMVEILVRSLSLSRLVTGTTLEQL
jgi:hypothetical protein